MHSFYRRVGNGVSEGADDTPFMERIPFNRKIKTPFSYKINIVTFEKINNKALNSIKINNKWIIIVNMYGQTAKLKKKNCHH